MKTRVQKWGNSLALRIPSTYAAEIDLQPNAMVELTVVDSKLVVTPLTEKELELERRLALITPENAHPETDFGPAVGKEEW
jgi:antitoxin MazE